MATNVFWGVSGALSAQANGDVLMIGDSWFWYPMDNLAVELSNIFAGHSFVVVGSNGAEAADWAGKHRKQIDFGLKMYGAGARAFVLSGGGNDLAGMSDFLRLINDDCSGATTLAECYRTGQPQTVIAGIEGCYRTLITRIRAHNAQAPILVHHYDHTWPTGQGVFGPGHWLKAPMDHARVPEEFRRPMFIDLIERLRDCHLGLAENQALGVVVVKSAGTLPDSPDAWANELHPTPKSFRLLAKKAFAPELRPLLSS